MSVKESAKQLVKLLEKLPNDRIPHFSSFKATQLDRFRTIAGLPVTKSSIKTNSKSITDIVVDTIAKKPKKDLEYKKELYSTKILDQQTSSIRNLLADKYMTTYEISDKLLKPKGNPNYYTRLNKDLSNGGKQKESIIDAFKMVVTGKY